jgi:hypothetical protein
MGAAPHSMIGTALNTNWSAAGDENAASRSK